MMILTHTDSRTQMNRIVVAFDYVKSALPLKLPLPNPSVSGVIPDVTAGVV